MSWRRDYYLLITYEFAENSWSCQKEYHKSKLHKLQTYLIFNSLSKKTIIYGYSPWSSQAAWGRHDSDYSRTLIKYVQPQTVERSYDLFATNTKIHSRSVESKWKIESTTLHQQDSCFCTTSPSYQLSWLDDRTRFTRSLFRFWYCMEWNTKSGGESECEITGHFFPNSCHLMAAVLVTIFI